MNKTKKPLIPRLRFPEFKNAGEWEEKRLGEAVEILDSRRKPISSTERQKGPYPYYGASGIIDYVNNYIFDERLILIGEDGAKWGAFEKTAFIVEGKCWINNHAHVLKVIKINEIILENYLNMINISQYVTGAAPPKLTLNNLKSIKILVPLDVLEQQKIADFLSSLDEIITLENKKLEALKKYKKGLMQQLFPQDGEKVPRLRFPEFKNAGEWIRVPLRGILDYERPEEYIVLDDNYSCTGIPVLTANKSFVLGYTNERIGVYKDIPVIIFDDFTTDKKYVNFYFKIKSSAIKILKSKNDNNLKFIYEVMNLIKFDPKQHKRYYISEYQNILVPIPPTIKEQQKIADFLSSLDEIITLENKKLEVLKKYKKGLMQQLFPEMEE